MARRSTRRPARRTASPTRRTVARRNTYRRSLRSSRGRGRVSAGRETVVRVVLQQPAGVAGSPVMLSQAGRLMDTNPGPQRSKF